VGQFYHLSSILDQNQRVFSTRQQVDAHRPMPDDQTRVLLDRLRQSWSENGFGLLAVEIRGVAYMIGIQDSTFMQVIARAEIQMSLTGDGGRGLT